MAEWQQRRRDGDGDEAATVGEHSQIGRELQPLPSSGRCGSLNPHARSPLGGSVTTRLPRTPGQIQPSSSVRLTARQNIGMLQLACRTHRETQRNSRTNNAACGSIPWYVDCLPFILLCYIANDNSLSLALAFFAHCTFTPSQIGRRPPQAIALSRSPTVSHTRRAQTRPLTPVRLSRCFSSRPRSCRHESCYVERPSPFPINLSPRRRTS